MQYQKNLFTNKVAFLVVGILISLQMAITYMPQMHIIFRTASLQITDWLYPFYCGLILFSIVEIEKFLSNTLKKLDKLLNKDNVCGNYNLYVKCCHEKSVIFLQAF